MRVGKLIVCLPSFYVLPKSFGCNRVYLIFYLLMVIFVVRIITVTTAADHGHFQVRQAFRQFLS